MFEIYFIIGAVIVLNLYTHNKIQKDEAYFLDDEKPAYLAMLWYLPIIGAGLALYRLHADKTFYMSVIVIFFLLRYGIYALLYMFI